MADENFTTFIEVDSGGNIEVFNYVIDIVSMRRDANSSLYKDCGVNHFGKFIHYFQCKFEGTSGDSAWGLLYNISNTAAATGQDLLDANVGLFSYFYRPSIGVYNLILQQASNDNQDIFVCSFNTTYYLTFTRTAAVNTCKVYDDIDRTNLLDTLTVTFQSTLYRYVGAVGSRESSTLPAVTITYSVEMLDLNEAAGAGSLPAPSGILERKGHQFRVLAGEF